MRATHQLALAALSLASAPLLAPPVGAIELSGAWATNSELCDKVFTRKGSQLVFAELSDLYGSGFIIDNARIRGKAARCTIRSRKEDGPSLLLLASCATQLMHSNVEFSLKIIDDNSIARAFPGLPGLEVTYHRCKF